MTYHIRTISYDARTMFFWTLAMLSILALGIYFYSINMTIRNTALREDLESQVAQLALETGSLEFEYIAKKNSVGLELAAEYGLKEVRNPAYASRNRSSGLTLATE